MRITLPAPIITAAHNPQVRRAAGIAAPVLLLAALLVAWGWCGYAISGANDLDLFFFPAARNAYAGYPLQIYSVRFETIYPNANGPLSLAPMWVAVAVLAHFGWLENESLRHLIVALVFAPFTLLLARECLLAVEELRGETIDQRWRALAVAGFALSPLIWITVFLFGHYEVPLQMWLVLWGVRSLRNGSTQRAGALLGLALLTRTTTLLVLVPLVALLVARRHWRETCKLCGVMLAVTLLGLLPFLLADPGDVLYSLVTYRGALPVGFGSLWALAIGTPAEPFAQHFDMAIILLAVAILSISAAAMWREARLSGRETYGLLALVTAILPLLGKAVWPYYFLDTTIFVTIWAFGTRARWTPPRVLLALLSPAFLTVCALLNGYIVIQETSTLTTTSLVLSVALCALVGEWLLFFGRRLFDQRVHAETASPSSQHLIKWWRKRL